MKHKLLLFLFLFSLNVIVVGQTGTIKIAKPSSAKKDSLFPAIRSRFVIISAGCNYSLKKK